MSGAGINYVDSFLHRTHLSFVGLYVYLPPRPFGEVPFPFLT